MMDPIAKMLDMLRQQGVPRVCINATHNGVEIPEFVRALHGESLKIDLHPDYPLNMDLDEDALRVDLAFQGTVYRCTFPWSSIWGLHELGTTRTTVFPSQMPESILRLYSADPDKEPEPAPSEAPVTQVTRRPALRVIRGGKA